jgi:hypothetical protein
MLPSHARLKFFPGERGKVWLLTLGAFINCYGGRIAQASQFRKNLKPKVSSGFYETLFECHGSPGLKGTAPLSRVATMMRCFFLIWDLWPGGIVGISRQCVSRNADRFPGDPCARVYSAIIDLLPPRRVGGLCDGRLYFPMDVVEGNPVWFRGCLQLVI